MFAEKAPTFWKKLFQELVVMIVIMFISITLVYVIYNGGKALLEEPVRQWEENNTPAYILNHDPVETTVKEMISLWEMDHESANKKYSGRHIIVSGLYGGTTQFYGSDDYFIHLKARDRWITDPFYARVKIDSLPVLSKYSPGDPITIDGVLQGHEFYRRALINHATIIRSCDNKFVNVRTSVTTNS